MILKTNKTKELSFKDRMKIVYPQLTMVSLAQIPGSRITRSSSPSCRILVTEIPRLVAALANPNETFVNGRRRFDCW